MAEKDILVVGATGTQGGSVARALLRRDGFTVHALTREPSKEAAQELERAGANTVQGDLEDRGEIEENLEGIDAVFGVTDFWEHGYDDEVEQGTNLAEAVASSNVEHLVFSSVGSAHRETGIAHFDSKLEIEERISELGIPCTIFRPVYFMQNFEAMQEQILDGTLSMALEPGRALQMLDIEDYGELVAEAFQDPDRYLGMELEVASDEMTLESAAARFSDIMGMQVRANRLTLDELKDAMGEEYEVMFRWFNEEGYEADISQLRAEHDVDWNRFETYLEREGWQKQA